MKISYLGIPGSYSFIAAQKYLGDNTLMIGSKSIADIFQTICTNLCLFGAVPLENSTSGTISETYDLLIDTKLSIIGEVILRVHHHLLGHEKINSLKKPLLIIRRCYSHPQAFSQCKSLFQNFPLIKPIITSDTASAARLVAKRGYINEAAIGGVETAKIYGLTIIKKNIETSPNNYTRFVILAKKENKVGNKISLVFSLEHVPGSLFRALAPYKEKRLNLTKIESRPIVGRPWEYIFFLDFEINGKEREANEVIAEMKEVTNFLTILGRYQKGKIYET